MMETGHSDEPPAYGPTITSTEYPMPSAPPDVEAIRKRCDEYKQDVTTGDYVHVAVKHYAHDIPALLDALEKAQRMVRGLTKSCNDMESDKEYNGELAASLRVQNARLRQALETALAGQGEVSESTKPIDLDN